MKLKDIQQEAAHELDVTLTAFTHFCRALCSDNDVTLPCWYMHAAKLAHEDMT